MCHSLTKIFKLKNSSFAREGSFADLVVEDSQFRWTVEKDIISAKFGWSPFYKHTFTSKITHTFVNGYLAYGNGKGH